MKQMKINLGVVSLVAGALAGCAGMTFKKDAEKTAKIKTVAIVAASSQQQRNSQENIVKSLLTDAPESTSNCKSSEHVSKMAEILESSLQKDLGFKTISHASVIQNPNYQKVLKQVHSRWGAHQLPEGHYCLNAPETISALRWPWVEEEEILELKKALNVDAIVVFTAYPNLVGTQVLGVAVGGAKTRVRLDARMFDGEGTDPIFFSSNAQGELVQEGTESVFGFRDRDVLNQKALIGFKSAASKLTEQYKKGSL